MKTTTKTTSKKVKTKYSEDQKVNDLVTKYYALMKRVEMVNKKIPNINSGGCGVFAEHLYLQLKKLGFQPKLVVLTDNKKALSLEIKLGQKFYELPYTKTYGYASLTHVVVEVYGDYIDSTGKYSSIKEMAFNHEYQPNEAEPVKVDFKTLKEWNSNPNSWNSGFNRKYIPKIEKILSNKIAA